METDPIKELSFFELRQTLRILHGKVLAAPSWDELIYYFLADDSVFFGVKILEIELRLNKFLPEVFDYLPGSSMQPPYSICFLWSRLVLWP